MPDSESIRERTESLASMDPTRAYLPTWTTNRKLGADQAGMFGNFFECLLHHILDRDVVESVLMFSASTQRGTEAE